MREIHLTGSVPLKPASAVFEALARHLGTATPRYPDGEQAGWSRPLHMVLATNPALEEVYKLHLNPSGSVTASYYRLKAGLKAKDLKLGPFGIADSAITSYREFKRLKENGTIPPGTRFQFTVPGAGMLTAVLFMLPHESFPIAANGLWEEIKKFLSAVPAGEIALQFDLPAETSFEEYERRPWAFNVPYFDLGRQRLQDGVAAFAWLANQIPTDVPIGIHTCSLWHVDGSADQDNRAIADIANQYLRAVRRPLNYINIPIHPDHTRPSDYMPFRDLELKPETVLSFGLINLADGLEGAKKRIAAAEKAGVFDFGVSFWCGLGRHGFSYGGNPTVRQATSETIGELLDLHVKVASV